MPLAAVSITVTAAKTASLKVFGRFGMVAPAEV
jgi:hypothetical protein